MSVAELIPVTFDKIMQTRAYTVVILGTPEKRFAIYTEPNIGRIIQLSLSGSPKIRPHTHDLISMMLQGLDVHLLQVIINDIQDTVYFARLFLERDLPDGQRHIIEIDARPSDSITLALMNDAPVFCTRHVLDQAVPVEE